MGVRARLGKGLEATLGKERTDRVRNAERRTRQRLADKLAPLPVESARPAEPAAQAADVRTPGPGANVRRLGEPNDRQGGWIPSDPFVPHPQPTMTRHDLLRGLHEGLAPRTYLEIGVNEGASLSLSRTKSIGVDPDFRVRHPLSCDLDLVKAKSDEFFTRPDALAHFDGVPVDLAFIDGMHLSEFAVRDFINVERHLAPAGVAVFDDILPRNVLEAARDQANRGVGRRRLQGSPGHRPQSAGPAGRVDQHLADGYGDRGGRRRVVECPAGGLLLRNPVSRSAGPAESTAGVHVTVRSGRSSGSARLRGVAAPRGRARVRRCDPDRQGQGPPAVDPDTRVACASVVRW